MINYVVGDATRPIGDGPKVLPHICNDIGAFGAGYVLALAARWPIVEKRYRAWYKNRKDNPDPNDPPFALGEVQFVQVEDDIWVANMIGQHGLISYSKIPPIRYEAVRAALSKVSLFCNGKKASLHMPRISTGLAGGTWDEMEKILQEELGQWQVTVYDLDKPNHNSVNSQRTLF